MTDALVRATVIEMPGANSKETDELKIYPTGLYCCRMRIFLESSGNSSLDKHNLNAFIRKVYPHPRN